MSRLPLFGTGRAEIHGRQGASDGGKVKIEFKARWGWEGSGAFSFSIGELKGCMFTDKMRPPLNDAVCYLPLRQESSLDSRDTI